MLKKVFLLVVLMALLLSGTVYGQEATPAADQCADSDYAALATTLLPLVGNLTTPGADAAAAVTQIQQATVAMQAKCAGLGFSSEVNGNQPVLGPLTIPDGLYRVRVETDGYFIAQYTKIAGTCTVVNSFGQSLFLLTEGQASGGAEVVFQSTGCQAIIQISNVTKPWTFTFEKLG